MTQRGVVRRVSGTGVFSVEDDDGGYAVYEIFGVDIVRVGDVVFGVFRTHGLTHLHHGSTGRQLTVFGQGFDLDRTTAETFVRRSELAT